MMLNMRNDAHHDNDNEKLSFISLAAATANVVRYLEPTKDQKKQGDRDTARDSAEKENSECEREYIEHRLRELAAWERKISGRK